MSTRDLMDELEQVNSCWEAISCMLDPDGQIERDSTATLVHYFAERQRKLLEHLRQTGTAQV